MLTVASLQDAEMIWPDFEAIISIEDASRPEEEHRAFAFPASHALAIEGRLPEHLRLVFDDIDAAYQGYVPPEEHHVREAIEFARRHAGRKLLIHCHAGQCRSAAVALGVIADRMGPGLETEAVRKLLEIRPIAAPNLIALALVDDVLGRGGRLRAAWMAHEESDEELLRLRFLRDTYYKMPAP